MLIRKMAALALAFLLTATCAAAESASAPENDKNTALALFDGTALDVSQYEGKALFVNFFTGWCSCCMEEMPDIKKIYDAYDPEQLQIVLVHVCDGEDASVGKSVSERFGLEALTMIDDEGSALANLIGLIGYPTSLFIDAEGSLQGAATYTLTYDEMAEYMEKLGVSKRPEA